MSSMRGVLFSAVIVGACVCLTNCATRGPEPEAPLLPPAPAEFTPTSFLSPIHLEAGSYANLFAADSYAIWVGADVDALKRAYAKEAGQPIDPALETLSQPFNENFLVFEVHLASAFADMSIGYDAVGLRGADVYLTTADGKVVRPVQTLTAGPLRETQEGAIKRFERVNLVVFPRKNLSSGVSTVAVAAPAARLVIEAVRSKFYFEWGSALSPANAEPTMEDKLRAVKLGFNDFYRKLLEGAHRFD